MSLDYGVVQDYSDRGFGFVSRTFQSSGSKVFFHIKTVRRKYPQLAEELDDDAYYGVTFWYDTESTPKGEQVRELWLEVNELPEPQLGEARARAVQLWQDLQRDLPHGFDRMTRELLGPGEYEKLQAERDRRLHEQRRAEEQGQRREEEQRRKAQEEAQQRRLAEERRRKAETEERRLAEERRRRAEAVRLAPPKTRPTPAVRPSVPPGPAAPAQVNAQTDWWFQQLKVAVEPSPVGALQGLRQIETKVVGVTHENRQSVIRQLVAGEEIWLRREPDNPYDRNAIRVERQNGQQIGYISRLEAATWAPLFDGYGKPVPAVVTAVVGGYYSGSALGVRIRFTMPDTGVGKPPPDLGLDDNWDL